MLLLPILTADQNQNKLKIKIQQNMFNFPSPTQIDYFQLKIMVNFYFHLVTSMLEMYIRRPFIHIARLLVNSLILSM